MKIILKNTLEDLTEIFIRVGLDISPMLQGIGIDKQILLSVLIKDSFKAKLGWHHGNISVSIPKGIKAFFYA